MNPTPWTQINIRFADLDQAEHLAVTHLAPALTAAESTGLITAWFFIRKRPRWRLRYLPTRPSAAYAHVHESLRALQLAQHLTEVTHAIYEPETQAFGGPEAMTVAHTLWHLDSRHLLTHLAATSGTATGDRRRELSVLLCATMLRAAGLDWYEQGDVWARVAAHRRQPDTPADALKTRIQRLISIDTTDLTGPGGPLAATADWLSAYAATGRALGHLNSAGLLHRGLRDTLTHHVIFAWNRIGLGESTQSLLATTAATIIFGPDPTTAAHHQPTPTAAANHAGTRP